MFKRIACCLMVALALAMPALICGCEKPNEYHSSYQSETNTVVHQGEQVH